MADTLVPLGKSQAVRLADVLVLGPLMLYWAMKGSLGAHDRFMLGAIGAATIIYNLHHYRKIAAETAEGLAIQSEVIGTRG